ncbi:pyridoxal phosphate-dependent transferase [Dipodascopsis tothii]|uniref:pyridoxal phosphate-dependent transferase n=1 Tax=Dipodascopsis tothii TaxID=44089 RepID=UPI0034CD08E0
MLSRHIDPEALIEKVRARSTRSNGSARTAASHLASPYISRYTTFEPIPKYALPEKGLEPQAAYQLIHDDLDLDGKPNLNMASFVNTFIEDEAVKLSVENISKNLADSDEYPALMDIHARCINMIAGMWNASPSEKPIGSATTGSSEAIHLGGLAMKRRWQEARRAAGKDASQPNIVMGANAQVALEKFARYFDVEARLVPVHADGHHCMAAEDVMQHVDENTIGVFVILGSTYTGHYEPVAAVSKLLDEYEARTGHSVPIHVDAASGGFVAPFCHPNLVWDFRLPRVHSINTSGHKYGLVTAGLGWIIWRSEEYLPKHLVFELRYLGGVEQSFTLNFSRPGSQVIQQYYYFIHLGLEGYQRIQRDSLANARELSAFLDSTGYFTCVSSIHRKPGDDSLNEDLPSDDPEYYTPGLPVVAWRLSDSFKAQYPHVKQAAVSTLLRVKQYIIPNYPLPPDEEDIEILRVVVRESMTADLLQRLMTDIVSVMETLMDADEVEIASLAGPLKRLSLVSGPAHGLTSLGAASDDTSTTDVSSKHRHRHGNFKGVC